MAKALFELVLQLYLEGTTALYGDAHVYFAVGRGILNGLLPYRDLLDVKPPPIFLLSASSLWASGGEGIANLSHVVALAAIPVILAGVSWQRLRQAGRFWQTAASSISFMFGTAVVLYTVQRAGGIQTEPFSLLFSTLYLGVISAPRGEMSRGRVALAAACLLGAVGFKEPFALSLLGAALLLARRPAFLIRAYLVPLLAAAAMGICLLAALRYLGPYLTIDLPTIFGDRTQGNDPLWLRGLIVVRVFKDVAWFSWVPVFGYCVLGLWALTPALQTPRAGKGWHLFLPLLLLGSAYLFHRTYLLVKLLQALGFMMPLGDAFFRGLVVQYLALAAACCAGFVVLWVCERAAFGHTAAAILAVYTVVFAVGVGDFSLNHYILTVPVFLACLLVCEQAVVEDSGIGLAKGTFLALGVLLVFAMFSVQRPSYAALAAQRAERNAATAHAKLVAGKVDRLLTACGFDRYFYFDWQVNDFPTFTEHSPLALYWTQKQALGESFDPVLREQFFNQLAAAPVIFLRSADPSMVGDTKLVEELQQHFTPTPPPCAAGSLPLDGVSALFRNSAR